MTANSQPSGGSPLTPFVTSAIVTVALLVLAGSVFASRYLDMREVEALATRLTRLEGKTLRLQEILTMSAQMAVATGDPQWEQRYHQYDDQLDQATAEVVAIAPDAVHAAAEATLAADRELDAQEHRALELILQGQRAEAEALFDAAYDRLLDRRARGMTDLMLGVGHVVVERLEDHRRSVIAAVCGSAAALMFLVALWLRMLRQIRRYIADRTEAEDQLRKAQASLETRVADRTREVAASREQYRSLVENIDAIPFEWDPATRRMVYIAPQAAQLFGRPIHELHGAAFLTTVLHADDHAELAAIGRRIEAFLADRRGGTLDCRMVTAAGETVHVRIRHRERADGQTTWGMMADVTQQLRLESELQQAQKLESIGRLAAGIAHEINTPVQFVADSMQFVRDSMTDLLMVIDKHRRSTERAAAGQPSPELAREAQAAEIDADLPYLSEQLPRAIDRALEGMSRVATIVRSMKLFAHPRKELCSVDLNEAISSTLTIARNEYKYVAELETDFAELPPVWCYPGELNQVVLNLVTNAGHAIADAVAGTEQHGRITVTTRCDGDQAVIAIADTGTGIPPAIRSRIFEPFFTTKAPGKGTGQGLCHARSVIVDKHHGSLTFDTEVGAGTTFTIRIPIATADALAPEPVAA